MVKRIATVLLLCTFLATGCSPSAPTSQENAKQGALKAAEEHKRTDIHYSNSGFSQAPVKASMEVFAMDTVMTMTVYAKDENQGKKALEKAADEIERLDNLLSTNRPESEIYKINAQGKGVLTDDGKALMEASKKYYDETNGVFNIAIYPITKAWGFTTETFQVPSSETLKSLLPKTDFHDVSFDEKTGNVTLTKEGMGIDFGGIAKGYTSSRLMEIFSKAGINSGLVSLGGNVQVLGAKPDGSVYRVAIQDPDNSTGTIGVLNVIDEAVVTSGAYERSFEKDGKVYHHIIDPATGAPSAQDLISVTIVSKDGTLSDAMATTLYIKGLEGAKAFWREHRNTFSCILVDKDRKVYVTPDLAADYEPAEGKAQAIVLTEA